MYKRVLLGVACFALFIAGCATTQPPTSPEPVADKQALTQHIDFLIDTACDDVFMYAHMREKFWAYLIQLNPRVSEITHAYIAQQCTYYLQQAQAEAQKLQNDLDAVATLGWPYKTLLQPTVRLRFLAFLGGEARGNPAWNIGTQKTADFYATRFLAFIDSPEGVCVTTQTGCQELSQVELDNLFQRVASTPPPQVDSTPTTQAPHVQPTTSAPSVWSSLLQLGQIYVEFLKALPPPPATPQPAPIINQYGTTPYRPTAPYFRP